ncbi:hypothetical protein BC829DRAFT_224355 [Chytridium lagenaria]|nr:hypothetical protein BC829DRAFT_224355 [Chytridium lagenaria]
MCSGFVAGRDPAAVGADQSVSTTIGTPLSPGVNVKLTMVRVWIMRERVTLWICRVPLRVRRQERVSVVSCSWGGGSDTQALRDSFALLKSRNIVMFSSAGNDGRNTDDGTPEVPKRTPALSLLAHRPYGRPSLILQLWCYSLHWWLVFFPLKFLPSLFRDTQALVEIRTLCFLFLFLTQTRFFRRQRTVF